MPKVTYDYYRQDKVVISALRFVSGSALSLVSHWSDKITNTDEMQRELDLRGMIEHPGLRLEGDIEAEVIWAENTHCDVRALRCEPCVYPKLAATGRLAGWKLHTVEIKRKGGVWLHFFQACEFYEARFKLEGDGIDRIAPNFTVIALGENGETKYTYEYLKDIESTIILEQSQYHARTILMPGDGKIMVEESVPDWFAI